MKTLKFFAIVVLSAAVAMGVTLGVDALGVFNYRYAFVTIFFATAIGMAALLGAFREDGRKSRFESIQHYDGRKNYGHAAVFIGTACLFMGTPQECDDMADDLWHHGQQVRVEQLTGEETDFNIL